MHLLGLILQHLTCGLRHAGGPGRYIAYSGRLGYQCRPHAMQLSRLSGPLQVKATFRLCSMRSVDQTAIPLAICSPLTSQLHCHLQRLARGAPWRARLPSRWARAIQVPLACTTTSSSSASATATCCPEQPASTPSPRSHDLPHPIPSLLLPNAAHLFHCFTALRVVCSSALNTGVPSAYPGSHHRSPLRLSAHPLRHVIRHITFPTVAGLGAAPPPGCRAAGGCLRRLPHPDAYGRPGRVGRRRRV